LVAACGGLEFGDEGFELRAPPPRYFPYGDQQYELDVELIHPDFGTHDADLQDWENSTKPDGTKVTHGEFDGPISFDGSYDASQSPDGTQTVKFEAEGHGHNVNVTVTVDPQGNVSATGNVDGVNVSSVEISGTGTLDDPFTAKVTLADGKVLYLRWTTQRGEIRKPRPKAILE
jgi:hypothetical protein